MSSLRYFKSGIHSEHPGIKTTRELATHVLPLLKLCRCVPDEDVPAQNQLDGWEDVEGVVHHQGHLGIEKTRGLVARKEH